MLNRPGEIGFTSYCVADDFGFTSIGIDHAGPGFVENIYESDCTIYKAYIRVITCTVTGAIQPRLKYRFTN